MRAYQREGGNVDSDLLWQRGHIEAWELLRVAAWKSAKALGELSVNDEDEIRDRTRQAMDAIRPLRGRGVVGCDDELWQAWLHAASSAVGVNKAGTGLLGLHGVRYPVATAVLCVLDPEVWPVIDRWSVRTVFGARPGNWRRAVVYQAFARHLATVGTRYWPEASTVHELDQKAMHAGMPAGGLPPRWQHAEFPKR